MVRIQIQITDEQARSLKRLAAKEGKSVAELIRISIDNLLRAGGVQSPDLLRQKAFAAAGKLSGPKNLAEDHDDYLAEALTAAAQALLADYQTDEELTAFQALNGDEFQVVIGSA